MARHLIFDIRQAYECGANDQPEKVLKELGIKYQHSTPQSIGDQWWFWNCENTPEPLPSYLKFADLNLVEMIGCGLAKEQAIDILRKELRCTCEAPLIRTGNNGCEYCGICEKDIID